MPEFVTIAKKSDLKPGAGITVKLQGHSLALFQIDSEVFAIDAVCPHKGGPLGEGCVENGTVYCPLHGWAFDLKTGLCRESERKSVRTHIVRIAGDEIQVELPSLISAP
jgi:nitrite reductase (NADH) small subunit